MENLKNINPIKVDKTTIINLEKGKLPPQALDLEEAVLGAMMIDKKGVDEVIDILQSDAFYKDAHKHIFEAIFQLFTDSQPIDLLTVSAQLKKNAKLELAGGDFYLIQLTQKISSSAHIEFHSRIILQKYIQRSLIRISSEIIEESYDETTDVFDLLDKAESKLYEVTQGNIKRSSETAQSLVIQAKKRIEEIANKEGLSGIATGFDKLDKVTSGWQPSDLVIIAARPGMGKTAFVLSMARNMAIDFGHPVALFSLEMSSVQLITRLISSETGLSSEKLRTGKLEKHEWEPYAAGEGGEWRKRPSCSRRVSGDGWCVVCACLGCGGLYTTSLALSMTMTRAEESRGGDAYRGGGQNRTFGCALCGGDVRCEARVGVVHSCTYHHSA